MGDSILSRLYSAAAPGLGPLTDERSEHSQPVLESAEETNQFRPGGQMLCHSGQVSLVLLILSLWTDMSQGLPRSQATFARDMRGDVMYNVADAGKNIVESIAI